MIDQATANPRNRGLCQRVTAWLVAFPLLSVSLAAPGNDEVWAHVRKSEDVQTGEYEALLPRLMLRAERPEDRDTFTEQTGVGRARLSGHVRIPWAYPERPAIFWPYRALGRNVVVWPCRLPPQAASNSIYQGMELCLLPDLPIVMARKVATSLDSHKYAAALEKYREFKKFLTENEEALTEQNISTNLRMLAACEEILTVLCKEGRQIQVNGDFPSVAALAYELLKDLASSLESQRETMTESVVWQQRVFSYADRLSEAARTVFLTNKAWLVLPGRNLGTLKEIEAATSDPPVFRKVQVDGVEEDTLNWFRELVSNYFDLLGEERLMAEIQRLRSSDNLRLRFDHVLREKRVSAAKRTRYLELATSFEPLITSHNDEQENHTSKALQEMNLADFAHYCDALSYLSAAMSLSMRDLQPNAEGAAAAAAAADEAHDPSYEGALRVVVAPNDVLNVRMEANGSSSTIPPAIPAGARLTGTGRVRFSGSNNANKWIEVNHRGRLGWVAAALVAPQRR